MSDAESQAASPIDVDILCVHCGYNLRGLTSEGRCPECGGAIADSMRGELLRFADIEWLTRLRLGAALKLWAITVAILLAMGGGAIAIARGSLPGTLGLGVILSLVGPALGLWGTWCITAPDPRLSLSEQSVTLRKVIRACAAAALATKVFQHSGAGAAVASAALSVVMVAAGSVGWVAGWVASYAELFYFRRFARRAPDTKLAKSTTSLIWAVPILAACFLALSVVTAVVSWSTVATTGPRATAAAVPPGPGAFFPIFVLVGAFAGLFLFLWYVRLLSKYRKAFADTILQAKAIAIDPASVEHHHES